MTENPDMRSGPVQVLMVCLGNICRSPTAHGVLEHQIKMRGLQSQVVVDSAGTAAYHVGKHPDPRSIAAAASRGYDLSQQISRQVDVTDFQRFDYILAMDTENLASLESLSLAELEAEPPIKAELALLRSYEDPAGEEQPSVPDPYYSGDEGFQLVLDLVENACEGFLEALIQTHGLAQCSEHRVC